MRRWTSSLMEFGGAMKGKARFYGKGRGAGMILVVDDDADVVLFLKILLKREGYSVAEAYSGEECLSKLSEVRPKLIILDIMMPGMDGWEVCRKIKENPRTNSIPVLMLSVKKDDKDVKKSLEYARADGHLGKPFDLRRLIDAIGDLTGKGSNRSLEADSFGWRR